MPAAEVVRHYLARARGALARPGGLVHFFSQCEKGTLIAGASAGLRTHDRVASDKDRDPVGPKVGAEGGLRFSRRREQDNPQYEPLRVSRLLRALLRHPDESRSQLASTAKQLVEPRCHRRER